LSNHAVMVRDYPEGVPLSAVLAAVEHRDQVALARLRELQIDPRVVGRRLLQAAWWAALQAAALAAALAKIWQQLAERLQARHLVRQSSRNSAEAMVLNIS
jgi:hypothetical protein